jgi:hypothetical protein
MTKTEIKTQMEAKGIFKTNGSRDALWVKAFELYNETQKMKLRMGCGSCYNKVRSWLAN